MQLKEHLEAKGFFAVKQIAMELAPAGRPNFPAIFDNEKTAQISTWNRLYGKETTAKLIFAMLEDLNNYFNVQRPMTTSQMTDLAIEMASQLWAFRLEEILAFSEAMKKGVYGKIYERFDPPIVWEQFENYNKAREEHFYTEATQHKQSDPIIEDASAKMDRRLNTVSGSIAQLKDKFKPKK